MNDSFGEFAFIGELAGAEDLAASGAERADQGVEAAAAGAGVGAVGFCPTTSQPSPHMDTEFDLGAAAAGPAVEVAGGGRGRGRPPASGAGGDEAAGRRPPRQSCGLRTAVG